MRAGWAVVLWVVGYGLWAHACVCSADEAGGYSVWANGNIYYVSNVGSRCLISGAGQLAWTVNKSNTVSLDGYLLITAVTFSVVLCWLYVWNGSGE